MASPNSTEASEIRRRGRHRLIGAIAIVVLLVVFVPMVLDSEPRAPRNEPAIQIPPKESAPPLPAPAPVTPANAPVTPANAPVTPANAPVTPANAPVTPANTPANAPVTPAKAGAPSPVEAKPDPKLEGFAVQVGAFKDEDKLKQAQEKLAFAGIKHYTERRGIPTTALTRVRAGPYPNREAADKALVAIRAAGLDGQVVPLP